MNLFFPLILDIISRSLHRPSCREANNSRTGPLNTSVRFQNGGLTGRWTDEWTDRPRQADRHVRGGSLPAGVAGEREHLPAGLRRSHGFCESGSPPTPAAGQGGPRRCQRVRGLTNGSTYHHLKEPRCLRHVEHLPGRFTDLNHSGAMTTRGEEGR